MKTCLFLTMAACVAAAPALAQSTDAEFVALTKAHKVAELESLARQRVARSPSDDVALWHWSQAVAGDAKKREELIPRLEQCAKDMPQSARCHHALGFLYGALASSGGLSAGLKYASSVKEMYQRAVELDPKNLAMRRDLNQFYLLAPGIVGGSLRKAVENASDFARIDASKARVLQVEIQVHEKEFGKAEALLKTIAPGNDPELLEATRLAAFRLGAAWIDAGDAAKAQRWFERQVAEDGEYANGHFGLGRALLEQKMFGAAVLAMERALKLDPSLRAHYRLGLAYQGAGEKARAASNFQQYLAYSPQGKAADDARKRLDELKS